MRNRKYHVLFERISEKKALEICRLHNAQFGQPAMRQFYQLGRETELFFLSNLPAEHFVEVRQKNFSSSGCEFVHGFEDSCGIEPDFNGRHIQWAGNPSQIGLYLGVFLSANKNSLTNFSYYMT